MSSPDGSVLEQLGCIVNKYPVSAGDTISHKAAKECAQRGWTVLDAGCRWIPTAAGIIAWCGHAKQQ
jgi:hypothetical protein